MIVLEIFSKGYRLYNTKKSCTCTQFLGQILSLFEKKNSTFVIMTQITNRKLLSKVLKLRNNISP